MSTVAQAPSIPRASPTAWAAAALVVAAALAFDPWGWAPFGPLKWGLTSTLVLVAAALAAVRPVSVHRLSAIVWLAFLAWGAIVSVGALDPVYTWIGSPDRHLGLVTWGLFAVAFAVGQNLTGVGDFRLLARAVVVATIGVGLYAAGEAVGFELVAVTGGTSRLGGTLGSPAYLGAALALFLPVSAGAAADGAEAFWWRAAATFGLGLGVVAVIGTQTRAAWVGLVAAAAFAAPGWWRWLRSRPWIAVAVAALLATVIAVTPVGGRLVSAVDFDDGGGAARLDEWAVGGRALAANLATGVGFEGYRIAFPTHVDGDYTRSYGRDVVADRAHNTVLDVGIAAGIPGAVAALTAAAWLVTRSWRGVRSGAAGVIGISAGVVGYVVQAQFLFPVAEIEPVFWVLAGVLVTSTARREPVWASAPSRLATAAFVALAILALVAGALDVAADRRSRLALDLSATQGEHAAGLTAADQAVRLRRDSIRYGVIAAAVAAAPGDVPALGAALDRIDAALAVSPGDPILRARRARLLLDRARASGDRAHLDEAVTAWDELVTDDPTNPQHLLELGVALVLTGDEAGAETAWLAAERFAPTSAVPATNLALLYMQGGRFEDAETALARGLAIDPRNPALLQLQRELTDATSP